MFRRDFLSSLGAGATAAIPAGPATGQTVLPGDDARGRIQQAIDQVEKRGGRDDRVDRWDLPTGSRPGDPR